MASPRWAAVMVPADVLSALIERTWMKRWGCCRKQFGNELRWGGGPQTSPSQEDQIQVPVANEPSLVMIKMKMKMMTSYSNNSEGKGQRQRSRRKQQNCPRRRLRKPKDPVTFSHRPANVNKSCPQSLANGLFSFVQ